ncbi:hypothetical protein DFQ27_004879 [Actinomortierella ambigua]|uniref:Major facilitator superfamily (MFS) profile domain-containing protein n=1 Tax=Actinomortierella ambigua TaxID=1343610 RepID=A0A9P6Q2K8_9FUNG|nr:hypothetical protein DFQ26_004266 [Actinomortierella ambigua]KAG0257942.1 hypothetical protein DFQ27_004879 [Actinomortierella ambigua]
MDSREATFPKYMLYCGIIAALTSLSIGYVIGSPNVPEKAIRGLNGECGPDPYTTVGGFPNCLYFSDILWGFAVGSFCLGAMAGGLSAGYFQNHWGRLRTLLFANAFFVVGSLLLALTAHQAQFIVGRIVVGFGCGLGGVVAPTYLGEISTIKGRGLMGTMFQLLVVIGILISNLIGLGLSTPPLWRIMFAISAIPSLIQTLLLPSLPESPRYLLTRGRNEDARHALERVRGGHSVDHEFSDMVQLLQGNQQASEGNNNNTLNRDSAYEDVHGNNKSAKEEVARPDGHAQTSYGVVRLFSGECRNLALIGLAVHFFQQASGINGLIYYSTSFLGDVFGAGNSKYITVGVSICNLLATIAGVFLIDRMGRRTLLMISFVGLTISCILLVIGAYADVGVLVVVSVFLYTAFFAVGLGPIPWMLLSEILPTYALSPASAVATCVNWGTNFVVGLVFPSLNKGLGNGTFILFMAFCAAGAVYTWFLVPETRHRPIEDIMAEKGVAPRSDYL